MLDRKEILERAYVECMSEMYAKSQPSGDYKQYVQDVKDGKIGKDELIYERHYLSHEEFKYILNKYIAAYGMEEKWKSNIETLEQYFTEGGMKDKWIEGHTDKDGFKHSGHRGYEKVAPIKEQIQTILQTEIGDECTEVGNKIAEAVMNTIKECKEFYRFDREENDFSCSIALGASPTSNPDSVIKYWSSQGIDIKIEERNPLLFWEQEYYGDGFEEVMEYEYGENWIEYWNNKWQEEKNDK